MVGWYFERNFCKSVNFNISGSDMTINLMLYLWYEKYIYDKKSIFEVTPTRWMLLFCIHGMLKYTHKYWVLRHIIFIGDKKILISDGNYFRTSFVVEGTKLSDGKKWHAEHHEGDVITAPLRGIRMTNRNSFDLIAILTG